MKLGLDIDGTVGSYPAFFTWLAEAVRNYGGTVHVVTLRYPHQRAETEAYLREIGLEYDALEFTGEGPKAPYVEAHGLDAFADDGAHLLRAMPRRVAKMVVIS